MKNYKSNILEYLIKKYGQRILIPFYHAVSNTNFDFIGDLYPPRSITSFEKDLDTLLKFYKPISLEKLIEIVKSEEDVSENYFHITFDDGLANFYSIVAPILKKKNIPATVFLNTDFVDNKNLFYRYKASLLLNKYNDSNNKIKKKYYHFMNIHGIKEDSVSDFLLGVSYQNKNILDSLAKELNYDFQLYLKENKPYLSKNQIKELLRDGFTIGAHSVDHPFYYQISGEEQLKQTIESVDWVRKEFDLDYNAFSFPFADFGVEMEFYNKLNQESIIDISFGTSGIKKGVVKNNLQRISFEHAGKNTKYFLIREYLKYIIKIPLGKSVMKRK